MQNQLNSENKGTGKRRQPQLSSLLNAEFSKKQAWKSDTSQNDTQDDWRTRIVSLGLDDKEWLRTREAVSYSGLAISQLYELGVSSKEIKSFLLLKRKDSVRGTRLWSKSSIEQYFNRKYEEAIARGNPVGVVAWAPKKQGNN